MNLNKIEVLINYKGRQFRVAEGWNGDRLSTISVEPEIDELYKKMPKFRIVPPETKAAIRGYYHLHNFNGTIKFNGQTIYEGVA